jgi:hypothetical protein
VRLQEVSGAARKTMLMLARPKISLRLSFTPYELKTVRIDRTGKWHEVDMVEEQ